MKKISRSHHSSLNELNITPLLDLAFVLLIIFIITTPLLEQGMSLRLPVGGVEDHKKLDPRDIRSVDVSPQGWYKFRNQIYQSPDQIAHVLRDEQQRNPNLIVAIRADGEGLYKFVARLIDRLGNEGVANISLRYEPPKTR